MEKSRVFIIVLTIAVAAALILSVILAIKVYGVKKNPGVNVTPVAQSNTSSQVSTHSSNLSVTEYGGERAFIGQVIFEENFNTFNLDVWNHEVTLSGGGNGEFQLYDNNRSNSYVKDGNLFIMPTFTSDKYGESFIQHETLSLHRGSAGDTCTDWSHSGCERSAAPSSDIINPIMSAKITTKNSFSFKYGKVEIRAKLPKGDWLWPAIWMLPRVNNYGTWPTSGEIDIMESRGNVNLTTREGKNIGVGQMGSTLHYGPSPNQNGWDKAHFQKQLTANVTFNNDFHLFALEWTPEKIEFIVDNSSIGRITPSEDGFWHVGKFTSNVANPWVYGTNKKMAPFDQEFYLIINLAVGATGGYFPDVDLKPWKNGENAPRRAFWEARKLWEPTWTGDDKAFQVDYICVKAL